MRNIILSLGCLIQFSFAFSQQDSLLKSKKGKLILPEKHDIGIGISGNSVLSFIGNMMSNSGSNRFYLDLVDGNSLYGKYFVTKKSALRLRLYFSQSNAHYSNMIPNDLDPTGKSVVFDDLVKKAVGYNIALGYEKRHGSGRLQIFYGAELILARNYTTNKYTYANQYSTTNNYPTTTLSNSFSGYNRTSSRNLRTNTDSGFGYGIRGFVGLEYFIFPKIAVAGEFGVSGIVYTKGINSYTQEAWNFNTKSLSQNYGSTKNDKSTVGTDNLTGQIMLLFYVK